MERRTSDGDTCDVSCHHTNKTKKGTKRNETYHAAGFESEPVTCSGREETHCAAFPETDKESEQVADDVGDLLEWEGAGAGRSRHKWGKGCRREMEVMVRIFSNAFCFMDRGARKKEVKRVG